MSKISQKIIKSRGSVLKKISHHHRYEVAAVVYLKDETLHTHGRAYDVSHDGKFLKKKNGILPSDHKIKVVFFQRVFQCVTNH